MEKCKVDTKLNFNNQIFKKIISRGKLRIEILDGLIRISTNDNGNWLATDKPFELKSSEIRKKEVTHMYVGVWKKAKGHMKVTAYKYV